MAAIDGAARLRALAAFLAAPPCPLLLGMRMIDALATDVFGRLPDGWDAALRRFTWADIRLVAAGGVPLGCPGDMADFLALAESLSLKRSGVGDAVSLGGDGDGGGGEGWGEWLGGIPPLALDDTLARSMRLKKRHEVERCAALVEAVCRRSGVTDVVDVGSGEGYLDAVLAHGRAGLRVIGLEMHAARQCSAQRRAAAVAALVNRRTRRPGGEQSGFEGAVPEGASLSLRAPSVTFKAVVVRGAADILAAVDVDRAGSAVLVGLHTCGRLTPLTLQAFVQSPALAVVCVGCCYRGLADDRDPVGEEAPSSRVFPISEALPRERLPPLSAGAFELATHAAEHWTQRSEAALRQHGNRCILELLLGPPGSGNANGPSSALADGGSGGPDVPRGPPRAISRLRLKRGERAAEAPDGESFLSYARAVLRHEGDGAPVDDDRIRECYAANAHHIPVVAALYAVRLAVARALESLIVLDRAQYLREGLPPGSAVLVVPLFDPSASPRTLTLLASRPP